MTPAECAYLCLGAVVGSAAVLLAVVYVVVRVVAARVPPAP